jgi:hypothetical protein
MLTKTRPFAPRGDHDEAAALDRTLRGEFGWGEYENKVRLPAERATITRLNHDHNHNQHRYHNRNNHYQQFGKRGLSDACPGAAVGADKADVLFVRTWIHSHAHILSATLARALIHITAQVSKTGKDFVAALLVVNQDKRLGSLPKGRSNPLAVKAHPWFSDLDWLALSDHKVKPLIEPLQVGKSPFDLQ